MSATDEQMNCSGPLELRDDGIWFCPKCGLEIKPKLKKSKETVAPSGTIQVLPTSGPSVIPAPVTEPTVTGSVILAHWTDGTWIP